MLKKNLNFSQSSLNQSQNINLENRKICDRHMPVLLQRFKVIEIIQLNLHQNDIEGQISTWSALGKLKNLKRLNLSNNNLKHCYMNYLPSSLQILNMSNNYLSQIHLQSNLNELKELYLQSNTILRFQSNYPNDSLRFLDISKNKLSILGIGHLTQLTQLDARDNQIVVINLPSSIQTVNLDQNMIKNIGFIARLNSLLHLTISNNQIKELDLRNMQIKRYLTYLDISNNNIKVINGLDVIFKIQILKASNNCLPLKIQNQIKKLKYLRQFQIQNNQFNTHFSQIQVTESTLKQTLPLKHFNTFDSQKPTMANTAQNSERKKSHKKYTYMNPSETGYLKKQRRNHSEVRIKDSPFKLFIDTQREKPTQYTLGTTQKQKSEKSDIQYKDPQTKYFLQILDKYYLIPKKPILKRNFDKTHFHEIQSGMQYNLLRDLYRSFSMKISNVYKSSNMKQLQEIEQSHKQNKQTQSLYFMNNEIDHKQIQKYIDNQVSFQNVVRPFIQKIKLSLFPIKQSKNYIIKTNYSPKSKQNLQFNGINFLFSLIYYIQ